MNWGDNEEEEAEDYAMDIQDFPSEMDLDSFCCIYSMH